MLAPIWGSTVEGVLPVLLPRRRAGFLLIGGRKRALLPAWISSQQLYLAAATNWKLSIDLKDRLKIPKVVAMIELRQDLTKTCSDTKKGIKSWQLLQRTDSHIRIINKRKKRSDRRKKKKREERKRIKLQWKKECDVGEEMIKRKKKLQWMEVHFFLQHETYV